MATTTDYAYVKLYAMDGQLLCLDGDGDAVDLQCYGEPEVDETATNQITVSADIFTDKYIKSANVSLAVSVVGDVLEYDTLEAELDFSSMSVTPSKYTYGTPVFFYHNTELIGKFYLSSISRTGRTLYTISCVSAIGLLANPKHYGGLYTGQTMAAVLADIVGGLISYTLDPIFDGQLVYGWLPVATRRENLHQLLFAMGAAVKKDSSGNVYITAISDEVTNAIDDSRIYSDGSVNYANSKTVIQLYEHLYEEFATDSEVTLFSGEVTDSTIITPAGSSVSGSIIVFDNPCHDLSADGTTILESGVNYAVLSPSGECVLTGHEYTHTIRQVTRPEYDVSTESDSDEVTVEDATLVSAFNSENVAARLMSYYSSARTVSGAIVVGSERPGDAVSMLDAYDEKAEGLLTSLDITVSGILKGDFELVADYEPSGVGNYYTQESIITSSGSWTVPSGVTRIRAILIGGGTGGASGASGEDGYDATWDNSYGDGGSGGAGGHGGAGGKVYIVTIDVTEGSTLTAVIGSGGAGGESSGAENTAGSSGSSTTFAGYTSASGTVTTSGYTDILTRKIYAAPGDSGVDGGHGGGNGSDWYNADGESVTSPSGTVYVGGAQGARQSSSYGRPGCGGGAAVGSAGGDGEDGRSRGRPGDGGDGGDATIDGVDATVYGSGGAGGHGGGGGGSGGVGTDDVDYGGDGGSGGAGSNGGAGASGCVIIYY